MYVVYFCMVRFFTKSVQAFLLEEGVSDWVIGVGVYQIGFIFQVRALYKTLRFASACFV